MIEHRGDENSGHYVTFAKRNEKVINFLNSIFFKWFLFNDESTTETRIRDLLKKEAYLLFY